MAHGLEPPWAEFEYG